MYKAQIKIYDKISKAKGETLLEAFDELKFTPPKLIQGGAILTAQKGDKKVERILNTPKVKRFALNSITRNMWAKLMEQGL